MAIRDSPAVSRPDHTNLQAGSEGAEILQDGQKIVTRGGATSAEADFDINGYNLNDGVYDLSSQKSSQLGGDNPDIGGTRELTILIESQDDNQFEVDVEFLDENDNSLVTVDKNIDGNLQSSSPSGGNHYIYVTLDTAGDRMNVKIRDTNDRQNKINGTINAH